MAVSDCLDVGLKFRAGTLQPKLQPWPETPSPRRFWCCLNFPALMAPFLGAGIWVWTQAGFGVEKLPRTSQGK